MQTTRSRRTVIPLIITGFLLLLSLGSLLYLSMTSQDKAGYIADIYQEGVLIMSIPLAEVHNSQTFTIEGENGCTNEVEVRPGSIRILSADCPDQICVRQGFISNSRLPITCLPNRLVIQLRSASENTEEPDMISY